MKIKVKNGYGIKDEVIFETPKNKITIFSPNGVGKTSIKKLFKNTYNEIFDDFGIENDGNNKSLIVDGMDMTELSEKKLLIIDEESTNQLSDYKNIIEGYINQLNPDKSSLTMFDGYDAFIEKINMKNGVFFGEEIFNEKVFSVLNTNMTNIEKLKTVDLISEIEKYKTTTSMKDDIVLLKEIKHEHYLIKELRKFIGGGKKQNLNIVYDIAEKGIIGYEISEENIFNLFREIKTKKLENNFGYRKKMTDEYKSIDDVYDEIEKAILNKGLKKVEAKIFMESIPLFTKYDINTKNKTIQPKTLSAIEQLIIDTEIALLSNILKSEKGFTKIRVDLEKTMKSYVEKYNDVSIKLSNTINSNNQLVWKIKVDKIKTPFEEREIKIFQRDTQRTGEQLLQNASSGQKKILVLALLLFDANSYDYIILDDVITSMDSDNSYIFIETLSNINKNIIMLTHNYSFLAKFGYKAQYDWTLFVLDSINEEKHLSFEADWWSVTSTHNLLKEEVSKELIISKYSMTTSVFYEIIEGYIHKGFIDRPDEKQPLEDIKSSVNRITRHWKGYDGSIKAFKGHLKQLYDDKSVSLLMGEKSIFLDLIKDYDSEVQNRSFNEYFRKNSSKNAINIYHKCNNLIDYISLKYLISMSMRFKIEHYIMNQKTKLLVKWDNNEIHGMPTIQKLNSDYNIKSSKENITLININNKIHFLNHLDNLKWIPILEMPMHKLISYNNKVDSIVDKTDKTIKTQ